jgi:hypothetical protein
MQNETVTAEAGSVQAEWSAPQVEAMPVDDKTLGGVVGLDDGLGGAAS